MTARRDDESFEAEVEQGLQQIGSDLPPGVATRLAAARRNALARTSRTRAAWRVPALAASAAALVAVVVLVWQLNRPPQPELLELAERDELELANDLDFYLWLDQMTRDG